MPKITKVDQQILNAVTAATPDGTTVTLANVRENGNKSRGMRAVTVTLPNGEVVNATASAGSYGSVSFQHSPTGQTGYRRWHTTFNGVLAEAAVPA